MLYHHPSPRPSWFASAVPAPVDSTESILSGTESLLTLRRREMDSNSSSLSGSVPLQAGGAVRGNHMVRPRGVSPWRDQWFESTSLQRGICELSVPPATSRARWDRPARRSTFDLFGIVKRIVDAKAQRKHALSAADETVWLREWGRAMSWQPSKQPGTSGVGPAIGYS